MNSRKHEERPYAARSEKRISSLVDMSCLRMVVAAFALLLSLHAHAAKGYAVVSSDGKTLTFKYGNPSGWVNVNYFNTDNTQFTPDLNNNVRWGEILKNLTDYVDRSSITKVVFESSFASARPKSCAYWFYRMAKLTTIQGIQYLNTSQVTDMSSMFADCTSLTSLDVTKFDTRNVTNMSSMFSQCSSLPSLDVTKFDTSKVTDMSSMFDRCRILPSLDVTKFDTSKVTNMSYMFSGCSRLSSLDVTKFDTSKVTNMQSMFSYSSLTSLDVTKFDTGNVTNMSSMFSQCSSLPSLDVTKFDTSKVTNMSYMFNGCSRLSSLDVTKFDTGQVTKMEHMFFYCKSLRSLDVTNFDTSQVINIAAMFAYCEKLPSLDVSNFDTRNVTTMSSMFLGCSSLTSLDVTKFDTSKVTDMQGMFCYCSSLRSLDVSNFDTRNVTNIGFMFENCSSLPSLDVSNFDTGNAIDIRYMFAGCSSLSSLDLRSFDTRNATDMDFLATNCNNLKCVVLGKDFRTEKTFPKSDITGGMYNTKDMFSYCPSLRYVDFFLSDDTDAINSASVTWMFAGCPETAVVYLPHGSQEIKDRQNFVYSYNGDANDLRCPMYYSVDKVDIEFPRQFRTNEAVYDRTATMGNKEYGSVILPFEFKSNSDIQAYRLNEQNQNMTELKMVNVQTVPEHIPFAFKRLGKAEFVMKDNSGNFGITVYPVRSTNAAEKTWTVAGGAPEETAGTPYDGTTGLSNWKTKGYYVKETKTDYDGMYFIQNDYFKRAVGPLNLVDHRVLFYPTDGSGAASFFTLSFEDEDDIATAIEAAETEHVLGESAAIYDASGCRLSEARKGLNIIRMSVGTVKKVFIK